MVEPHIVGFDKAGELILSAWQLSGGSGVGWRDFHLKNMTEGIATDQEFSGSRPGYNPNDSTLKQVMCRL